MITDVLERVQLFRGLDAAALAAVRDLAEQRDYPRGAYLFRDGKAATHVYALVAGRARILQTTAEGHQVVPRIVSPGQALGAVGLYGGARYPVSAQAMVDSRALRWTTESLRAMMERHPRIALNALQHVGRQLLDVQERYRELATERVERRLARALLRLSRVPELGATVSVPLSRQSLAEMTGTTLYTVSRVLRAWEREGLVASGREHVEVLSPEALADLADEGPE